MAGKQWETVAENMVRYVPNGMLYLRAKVNGKFVRKSLGMTAVRPAKLKRDKMLADLRAAAGEFPAHAPSVDAALALTLRWYESRTADEQKSSTLVYNRQIIKALEATYPQTSPAVWTFQTLADWWVSPGVTRYSATRRNGMLDVTRRMFDLLMEHGVRPDDPSRRLKRARVTSQPKNIPTVAELDSIVADVESQPSDYAFESANFIRFMAYSGARVSEAKAVTWEHISDDTITITGGREGTKNREIRRVPIIPPMRDLLEEMHYTDAAGPLFSIHSPRFALSNACRRLELPHVTPHCLRHLFCTVCLMSGCEPSLVASWAGHKDGGALLLKTYSHLFDDHSQAQAQRVNFTTKN